MYRLIVDKYIAITIYNLGHLMSRDIECFVCSGFSKTCTQHILEDKDSPSSWNARKACCAAVNLLFCKSCNPVVQSLRILPFSVLGT